MLLSIISGAILFAQDLRVVKSELIPNNDSIYIFKPSSYDKGNKMYPLIYLLHGYMGDYKQWSNITDLQLFADEFEFIIVCPDGFKKSWYLNSPILTNWQYESYFFSTLVPYLHKNYRVSSGNVFISGLSMGGHGSLHLYCTKPEYFKAAGSMSGVMNLRNASASKLGLIDLLGSFKDNNPNWDQFSVINNIHKIKELNKPIIFDCGTEDGLLFMNDELYKKCINLNISTIYTTPPGSHNHEYWSKSILAHLVFFYQLSD